MDKKEIESIYQEALEEISKALDLESLYNEVKVKFLGKKGKFSSLMKEMKDLSAEQKPLFGKLVNEKKKALEEAYETKQSELKQRQLSEELEGEKLDLFLPGAKKELGALHPLSLVTYEMIEILSHLGFSLRLQNCTSLFLLKVLLSH